MEQILIFIAGVALGLWFGKRIRAKGHGEGESNLSRNSNSDGDAGNLSSHNIKRETRVEENKEKIMGLFSQKSQIANDDVESLLSVSDASATNYLNSLEEEGKIVQIGKTGRAVEYRQRKI
ncbi:MAG: hypothetical protein Q8P52_00790 [bacterium]|nr:hypothetical protein [bacterium]